MRSKNKEYFTLIKKYIDEYTAIEKEEFTLNQASEDNFRGLFDGIAPFVG